jgi:hypothetical protein
MSFWNIDLDGWKRRRRYDESISAYRFYTSGRYDNRIPFRLPHPILKEHC